MDRQLSDDLESRIRSNDSTLTTIEITRPVVPFLPRLCESLTNNTAVSRITLNYCNLQSADISTLANTIATSPIPLRILSLSNNPIGTKGAIILARLLDVKTTIRELYLANCSIQWKGARVLSKSLKNLSLIDISLNPIGNNGTVQILHNTDECYGVIVKATTRNSHILNSFNTRNDLLKFSRIHKVLLNLCIALVPLRRTHINFDVYCLLEIFYFFNKYYQYVHKKRMVDLISNVWNYYYRKMRIESSRQAVSSAATNVSTASTSTSSITLASMSAVGSAVLNAVTNMFTQ